MKANRPDPDKDTATLPPVARCVTPARAETPEDVAFLSGAALAQLHVALGHADLPHALLRERLALGAAEACVAFAGRSERGPDLRDAVHLMRPGDLPGPAGETYVAWRRAVERPVSVAALHRALPEQSGAAIAAWLDAGQGAPIRRAAQTLETVLESVPRGEATALILADAALARALGWGHAVPLLAAGLKRADLRKTGAEIRTACHRAVTVTAIDAVRKAADLTRRAAHLRAVAPKLRAKGAGAAVNLFLTRDAVAAAALPLPDRAARRLCDRLVDLGAIRELTGRETFRLYGV
ncbi:uncharacterized protein DUF1403 [Maritimibacter alkaliphilus HTCC2654]|uniref:DUF1403 family protein n=1 Tax=Maritimibacter alkaliphilus HTCC2654 TaxID=314271 RepID=A3VK14_9RHOB|nr:DUF1403 family protein [Maritimibacter alkaliphilus]EAQ11319.1 hypothetical protein RB2654_23193 [Rhodobacterales bacterium HTCC2654] [Maritimibacter alkaliphilus HTCC2654]TYP80118.1 uncharacterized protein DUF1403 [Maritimibacter alkaliphilus HTCC2654]